MGTTAAPTTTTQSPTTSTAAASTSTAGPSTKTQLEQALAEIKALSAAVQALLDAATSSTRRRKRESEKEIDIHHRSQRAVVNVEIIVSIITVVKQWSFNSKYYNTSEGILQISSYTTQINSLKSEVESGGTIEANGIAELKTLTKSSLSVVTVII